MSFPGASISSIIMLSRVKELRFNVLDLSELKERRLGGGAGYQDNIHNDGEGRWRGRGGVGSKGGGEKVNRKNKHKHIKCMQLPGTWLYATSDNNNNHMGRKNDL